LENLTAGLVFAHGTDNALDEAACLVLHALQIGYDQPDAVLDQPISEADRQRVVQLLEQRITSRKPAAYLLNEAWFAGMPFYVDERVLVPRSPIAELIEARFTPWIHPEQVGRVLDMCTGSGCIGIACAQAFPDATVDLSDLSEDALDVAQENIKRHQLMDRVTAVQSDIFAAQLPAEFGHEPSLGLQAGTDGLDIIVQILRQAASHLADNGILVAEVGHSQDRLLARYPEVPFMWLDFEYGGSGVFLLDKVQLETCQPQLDQVASQGAKTG
jgi:ribosomal protein L3 glutamine methyltransferase